MFLYFDFSKILPNLNLRSSISLLDYIDKLDFTSTGFILIFFWYGLLYLLSISSNLSIWKFFELKSCIYDKVLLNLSAITDFPSLFVEYISM